MLFVVCWNEMCYGVLLLMMLVCLLVMVERMVLVFWVLVLILVIVCLIIFVMWVLFLVVIGRFWCLVNCLVCWFVMLVRSCEL